MDSDGRRPIPSQNESDSPISEDQVRRLLERILNSQEFKATPSQRAFLTFVVEKVLAGKSKDIKGYTVATEVFGRSEDFDQATDPVVSIHANKLRRALERYYLTAGKTDPIWFNLPKGTYVPVFQTRGAVQQVAGGHPAADVSYESSFPTVMVCQFQNLTKDPAQNFLAVGLPMEIANELTRYPDLRVVLVQPGNAATAGTKPPIRFAVEGYVNRDSEKVKVTVQLIDTNSGRQLWSEAHESDPAASLLISFQEHIARTTAVIIGGETGIIPKTLSKDFRRHPPARVKTYHAILHYYEYDQTLTTDSFQRAFSALQEAVADEPSCRQIWSMLARLYANIFSLKIPGLDDPLARAYEYAIRGVEIDPGNQRSRAVLALVYMFADELAAAREEIERARALNPNSLFILDGIGYIMTLIGEWEKGPALIRKTIQLNPYYRNVVHYALWVDFLRRGDLEGAYLETMSLQKQTVFWYPLARAATLGLIGRKKEGHKFVKELIGLKPEFKEIGRDLVRCYIKFDDIADQVFRGLAKCGLELK